MAAFPISAQIDEVIDRHKNRHGRETEKWVILLSPAYRRPFKEECEAFFWNTRTTHAATPERTPVQYRGYDVLARSRGKDIEIVRESDLEMQQPTPPQPFHLIYLCKECGYWLATNSFAEALSTLTGPIKRICPHDNTELVQVTSDDRLQVRDLTVSTEAHL